MKRFLGALAYLHERNIVHRDLKPANIILKSKECDNDLKLADFGLGVKLEEDEKLHQACGSGGFIGKFTLITVTKGPEVLHEG